LRIEVKVSQSLDDLQLKHREPANSQLVTDRGRGLD